MREEAAELKAEQKSDGVSRCSKYHRCASSPDINGFYLLNPYARDLSGSSKNRNTRSATSLRKLSKSASQSNNLTTKSGLTHGAPTEYNNQSRKMSVNLLNTNNQPM